MMRAFVTSVTRHFIVSSRNFRQHQNVANCKAIVTGDPLTSCHCVVLPRLFCSGTPRTKTKDDKKETEFENESSVESMNGADVSKSNSMTKVKRQGGHAVDRPTEKSVTFPKKEPRDKDYEYPEDDPPEKERHRYWKKKQDRSINMAIIPRDFFRDFEDKSKENFEIAIEMFQLKDVHNRGHVEFIYAALENMKVFGVHRDLEVYKKILDIFPKGRMIPSNLLQVEFMHYPKQQQCGIDVLEQMEYYTVMPDSEVEMMLRNIFGSRSFPSRKLARMLYWMPKFKNLSPFYLPSPLPDDSLELAKLAIKQITSVDPTTEISIFKTIDLEDWQDDTWIVSGQSPEQQSLIETHPPETPIYVEGAFRVWLKDTCINYFVLRAEPGLRSKFKDERDPHDVFSKRSILDEDYTSTEVIPFPSVHEQDDGVILAVCATGTSSRASVIAWIQLLEKTNPRLGKDISVLFTLRSPIGPTDDLEVLTHQEEESLKRLSETTVSSFGVDSKRPDLEKLGVWHLSDSKFPNWPHHHHQPGTYSYEIMGQPKITKKQIKKQQLLEDLEKMAVIGDSSVDNKKLES